MKKIVKFLFLCVLAFFLFMVFNVVNFWFDTSFSRKIKSSLNGIETISLSSITDFNWDKVCLVTADNASRFSEEVQKKVDYFPSDTYILMFFENRERIKVFEKIPYGDIDVEKECFSKNVLVEKKENSSHYFLIENGNYKGIKSRSIK